MSSIRQYGDTPKLPNPVPVAHTMMTDCLMFDSCMGNHDAASF